MKKLMKIVAVATAVVVAVAVGKAMVNKSSGKENPPEPKEQETLFI